MKSTEEPGLDIINKLNWAKRINAQNRIFKQLGFGQSRGCGQSVCERGLKEVMVKEVCLRAMLVLTLRCMCMLCCWCIRICMLGCEN